MSQLQIRPNLPLGLAWNWVKFSFATFREKPINFLAFSLVFIAFSIAPFIGSFLSTLVLVRIYLSADNVTSGVPFGLNLNLGQIIRQRNVVNFALFNMFFDLLLMSVFQEVLLILNVENSTTAMLEDHRVAALLVALSLFRIIFFGISLGVISFNPQIKLVKALVISWKFLFRNWIPVLFSVFLLLPFLVIPLYIMGLVVLSVTNIILFSIAMLILVLFILVFIAVTTIFSYKLYSDGVIVNG